jgi:hypothetical protein
MQQATCKLKMAKCNWVVVKMCGGEKKQDFFLCKL